MVVADPLDSEHFLAELAGSIPAGLLASLRRCWHGPLDLAAYPTSGTPLIQLQPTPGQPCGLAWIRWCGLPISPPCLRPGAPAAVP